MIPSQQDVARLQRLVAAQLGLRLELNQCWSVLYRRRRTPRYVEQLARDPAALRELVAELVPGETYFFRHGEQLVAYAERALPDRLAATSGAIYVVSAGCSTGEEPYTLAMLALACREPDRVRVLGCDVNPVAIAHAERGRYTRWALRALPPELERWFVNGELRPEPRAAVRFECRDLTDDRAWPPRTYDIVFCRNVVMYFTREAAREVVARLTRSLVPGGFLFLGHAEVLHERPPDLLLHHTHGTFYYEKLAQPLSAAAAASLSPPALPPPYAPARLVAPASSSPALPVPTAAAPAPVTDLAAVRALIRDERYPDALAHLERIPAPQSAEVLALRALVLTETNPLAATAAVRALLPVVPAVANYLLAVCREAAGDLVGAEHHLAAALALDPSFAMGHVRAGLVARRAGNAVGAATALETALVVLASETEDRLALYGGGLGRGGLTALCQGELAKLRGRA